MIRKYLDGGALEADGRFSTPMGASVAMSVLSGHEKSSRIS